MRIRNYRIRIDRDAVEAVITWTLKALAWTVVVALVLGVSYALGWVIYALVPLSPAGPIPTPVVYVSGGFGILTVAAWVANEVIVVERTDE